MTLSERISSGYCAPHGAKMPHYGRDGSPCAPDSPEAQAAYRAAHYGPAVTLSPFTRRALAGDLPGKVVR